ncbi:MAG: N-acetyltransferase family protein [Pseudomonadales bacterium]
MAINVRRAMGADAERVASLSRDFAEYLRKLGDTTDFQFTPETYRRDGFGVNPAFFGLVAETNAEIVGYLLYHFGYDVDLAARTLHIVDLYVSEESRRQGVGKSLMAFAQRVCRDVGAKEILWSVYKSNQPAYGFYARLGGEMVDDQDFMYLAVEP